MDILVVGGGGREHAIIKKLRENAGVDKIYALPGNGGIAMDAECFPIKATDIEGIKAFAKEHRPDYAVVAPDDPLVMGCVDELTNIGIPCFGPKAAAAVIEGSKVFSKNLMKKYGIPTARYHTFDNIGDALYYLESAPIPTVIKADADGKTIVPMISSMDHKRAGDGDTGLNTGGMGTVAPNPYYTDEAAARCMEEIFVPTMRAMNAEGRTFKGCLYFGLMLTAKGPKVIEYNCRFGDPEAQVVLPLLDTDLLTIMQAVTEERLADVDVRWKDGSACCVIAASDGYPVSYEKGYEIEIPEDVLPNVYVAGAVEEEGRLLTSGGRVLGVTAVEPTLAEAIEASYDMLDRIDFANKYYRADIGQRALKAVR